GDEQYLEDPTTNELQRRMAELLGHEAALFLPTATMANQAALRAQTKPGSVLLAEERTHILVYEWGGPAIHSGLIMRGVPAEAGLVTPEHVKAVQDPDLGPGGIVVLENTHRSSGGRVVRARPSRRAPRRRSRTCAPARRRNRDRRFRGGDELRFHTRSIRRRNQARGRRRRRARRAATGLVARSNASRRDGRRRR